MKKPGIDGFLDNPKVNANNEMYRGRFTCPNVQWTGEDSELFATFTITADELADAAEGRLIWTDQNVQRGILPGLSTQPPRELSLSDGYPNPSFYIFNTDNADEIVEKLLDGEQMFLNPLVWNLRPGSFKAYYDSDNRDIYIYDGKIYLPDSHHRQQAIVKAVRAWRESPDSFPKFSGSRQFKIELYFLTRENEGNYFFDKNQRPKPTAKSKAFDLTTQDDLSLLAKKFIDKSSLLTNNVNRVTDKLTNKNPQVVTLSTLREMMKTFAHTDSIDETEMDGLAIVAATFYDLLARVRPELGILSPAERRKVRSDLLVDSAVMMHGYAYLMRDFNKSMANLGRNKAIEEWKVKLKKLSSNNKYSLGNWSGDFFEKSNPIWQRIGAVKQSLNGQSFAISNTRDSRSESGRILKKLINTPLDQTDISFLLEAESEK